MIQIDANSKWIWTNGGVSSVEGAMSPLMKGPGKFWKKKCKGLVDFRDKLCILSFIHYQFGQTCLTPYFSTNNFLFRPPPGNS